MLLKFGTLNSKKKTHILKNLQIFDSSAAKRVVQHHVK